MLPGQFTIIDVVYGAGDSITSLAADFERHCEGLSPALFGSVRYNYVPPPFTVTPSVPTVGAGAQTAALVVGSTSAGTSAAFDTATPWFDAAGVPPGRYYLRVQGSNEFGTGPLSPERVLVVSPSGDTPPESPQNLTVSMSQGRPTFSWSPSLDGGAVTYLLEAGSRSADTDRAVVRMGALTAPPGPPALAGSASASTVTLDWTPSTAGDAATRYRIEAGTEPGTTGFSHDTGGQRRPRGFPACHRGSTTSACVVSTPAASNRRRTTSGSSSREPAGRDPARRGGRPWDRRAAAAEDVVGIPIQPRLRSVLGVGSKNLWIVLT